jgi:hypothetical protein
VLQPEVMTEQHELDPISCFLTACELERREHRTSRRERRVVNGRRISAEHGRFCYSFNIQDDAEIAEDTHLHLIVGDSVYNGTVSPALGQIQGNNTDKRSIVIVLSVDLGPFVNSARIESGEQDLLQALILKLKDLRDSEVVSGWNSELALGVLSLNGNSRSETVATGIKPPEDLTPDQGRALVRCLSQPITYLWGPPGTGKTVLLAALALWLYRENKRVLIVSHTNHGVDGVIEGLCKRITERGRTSIAEGSILRLGAPVKESLIRRYGDQVCLESVINRSHNKVSLRLEALGRELSEVRNELFLKSRKLALLDTYQQLREEIERVRNSDQLTDIGFISAVDRTLGSVSAVSADMGSKEDLIGFMEESLNKVAVELNGCNKEILNTQLIELSGRQLELCEAIAVLEKFVRDLRISLLDRARIVATTATHAMLSARDLHEFDAVLIDEASMLPLPLCFLLCGRARERVVIAGDFRQLPAIARSDAEMVQRWYRRDVFECAGVVDLVDQRREHPAVATLTTQFRSHEGLCSLINDRFYGGLLRTSSESAAERYIYRDPLAYLNRSPVVLVDTSELEPWGMLDGGSKLNLVHALVVRKLALMLSAHGLALLPDALGVIVPYRAQADLVRVLLNECSLDSTVSVGTVHRFQGSEREAIILDLTESAPHTLSGFLNPRSLRDTGARLLNVALSRARRHLLVVANLRHLRSQLRNSSIMWGVLDDIERIGYRLSAADVIGEQIFPAPSREVRDSPGILAFQSFDEGLFMAALVTDLLDAKAEVLISTDLISERAATVVATLLSARIARGVRVLVRFNVDRMRGNKAQSTLQMLRRAGVALLPVKQTGPATVIVDSEVLWLGSLAPLDCLDGSRGVMARTVSSIAARTAISLLGFDHSLRTRSEVVGT